MAAEEPRPLEPARLAGQRLGIAQGLPLEHLDRDVAREFSAATARLDAAGVRLTDEAFPQFGGMLAINAKGGFAPAEAFAVHRDLLESHGPEYDPNVRARIERCRNLSAADYVLMSRERARLIREMDLRLEALDALVMPTTAIVAPKISEVATPETFGRKNMMVLRNTIWPRLKMPPPAVVAWLSAKVHSLIAMAPTPRASPLSRPPPRTAKFP